MNKKIYINTKEKSISEIQQLIESQKLKSQNIDISSDLTLSDVIDYYESLIACMPGNIYWMDTECRAVGCNQGVLDMFGLSHPSNFVGLTFEDMAKIGNWNQGQVERFKSDSQYVMRTGNSKNDVEEPPIKAASGKEIYFLSNRAPLYNKNEEIIGCVGISTDISKLKKSTELFFYEGGYFKQLIDHVPHYIFWKDKNSVFLGCNQKFAKAAGFSSPEDLIGKTDYDLPWSASQSDAYRADDQEIIRTGLEKLNIEEGQLEKAGKEMVLLTSKVPLYDYKNEVSGVLGIYTDITHIKRTEQKLKDWIKKAEAASHAKSEFIANMSHDLRTPITGILGLAQSWQMTAQNQAHKEDAGLLIDTVHELLNLLNEILEVVNLDNGYVEEKIQAFEVEALVKHNIILLQSAAKHKNLDLRYSIDASVPRYVSGNRLYLDRSLLNVLSNAIKFTKKGSVTLSVSLARQDNQCVTVIFKITDTGIGIPQDKQEEIFQHFSRLTSSYQGIYKGTGLGLYTVKQYITAMKGGIRVTSIEGQGSTFTLEVPLNVVDPSEVSKESLLEMPAEREINSRPTSVWDSTDLDNPIATVLVVEDNELAARMACQLVRQVGCAWEWAGTGEEAVEKIKNSKYDLILMDIGLPDQDGLETTRQIRQLNHAKAIPIIALTGHLSAEKKEDCLAAGMQDFFTKPTSLIGFQQLLAAYVSSEKESSPSHQNNENPTSAELLKSIDLEEGARLVGGNKESAKELLIVLIKTLPSELEQITIAFEAKNFKRLDNLLHRFYGGLCYCGVPRLRLVTKQFKEAVQKAELEKAESLFFVFKGEVEVLINATIALL